MNNQSSHPVFDTQNVNRRRFLGGSLVLLVGVTMNKKKKPSQLGLAGMESDSNKLKSIIPDKTTIHPPDMLIKDGFIVTMDKNRTVYSSGDLYIKNGKIEQLGNQITTITEPGCILDAKQKMILPGFINTHAHLQQYFRGTYELIGDFYHVNLPLEMYRSPNDMEKLGAASCAEFIYGGCTTALVIYTYPEDFAKSVKKAGNRIILAADIEEVDLHKLKSGIFSYLPEKGTAAFQRAVELYHNWHGEADGRITTCLCPKAPDMARAELYKKCSTFAEKNNLRMTTHLSQTWREVQQVKKLYGKTPPQHLNDIGVLDDRLTGTHCDYITEKDLQLISESGMGILHCRSVTNPLLRWLDVGIPVGLGTDDYFHDMLPLLRQNITGQRTRARLIGGAEGRLASDRKTRRPTYYQLLELATRRGAETLGIDHEVGSLEPGKKADIIVVDMNNPYITPTKDPITSFVLYGSSRDIDTVIVDGTILKKDGQLTTINMKEALSEAQLKVEEIIKRFFKENPDQKQHWQQMVPYLK